MSPHGLRTAAHALYLAGAAGTVVLMLDIVSKYASSVLIICCICLGFALDIRSAR